MHMHVPIQLLQPTCVLEFKVSHVSCKVFLCFVHVCMHAHMALLFEVTCWINIIFRLLQEDQV